MEKISLPTPTQIENPIKALMAQTQAGTVVALALRLGVDASHIYQAYYGYKGHLGKTLLDKLATIGFDPNTIQSQYQAWREQQAQGGGL